MDQRRPRSAGPVLPRRGSPDGGQAGADPRGVRRQRLASTGSRAAPRLAAARAGAARGGRRGRARKADVAVVFVNDVTGEGMDRPSLALPGDQDQLIEAVARANPRTVVVLHTASAVTMPWRNRVAGDRRGLVSRPAERQGDRRDAVRGRRPVGPAAGYVPGERSAGTAGGTSRALSRGSATSPSTPRACSSAIASSTPAARSRCSRSATGSPTRRGLWAGLKVSKRGQGRVRATVKISQHRSSRGGAGACSCTSATRRVRASRRGS